MKTEFLNKRLERLEQLNLLRELDYEEGQELAEIKRIKQLIIDSVSKSFAVGVEVEITDCIKGHEFEIGEKVTIVEYDHNMWICRNKKGIEWYINEDEANVC